MQEMWFNKQNVVIDLGNQLKAFQPFALANGDIGKKITYLVKINKGEQ